MSLVRTSSNQLDDTNTKYEFKMSQKYLNWCSYLLGKNTIPDDGKITSRKHMNQLTSLTSFSQKSLGIKKEFWRVNPEGFNPETFYDSV